VIQQRLIRILSDAARAAAPELGLEPGSIPTPELTRPKQKKFGDWSTNLALVLAAQVGKPPRQVAEVLERHLQTGDTVTRLEIAGAGFINLFVSHAWLYEVLERILGEGPVYGGGEKTGERVQVEFVSANPVGPLHVGTARNAVLGDAVASVLEFAGNDVEREYYFNDAGRQLELFGESVEARYLERFGVQAEVPEDGYQGQQVIDLAEAIAQEHGDVLVGLPAEERRLRIREEAVARTMDGIRATLERFRIRFDTWVNERNFHESGAIAEAVARLREGGHAYEKDGAVFFRATEFGDEKDRVLIRSNGRPTYFGVDCAYLLHKGARGFDRLIYVLGADHHGTVKRLVSAGQALGVKARVEVLLYQLVHLKRGGEPVRMSKRAGDYITLDELLDEVGVDAARYTLLTRSSDSGIDFDIELVTRQTMDNPVYYVQYAHARIASLLRVAGEQGISLRPWREVNLQELTQEAELDLLRKLAEFPEVVALAAEALAPHRLTRFAEEVAARFHRFYTECRVITEDEPLTQARLWLATAARDVIASALRLIGVSAPESMERIGGGEA
jgi:arginyl-tRNA synthetase